MLKECDRIKSHLRNTVNCACTIEGGKIVDVCCAHAEYVRNAVNTSIKDVESDEIVELRERLNNVSDWYQRAMRTVAVMTVDAYEERIEKRKSP